jgi:hypothetical protein
MSDNLNAQINGLAQREAIAAARADRLQWFRMSFIADVYRELVVAEAKAAMQGLRDKADTYGKEDASGEFGMDFGLPLQIAVNAADVLMAAATGKKPAAPVSQN